MDAAHANMYITQLRPQGSVMFTEVTHMTGKYLQLKTLQLNTG